jgi:2'-5' RNA ligase
LNGWEKPVNPDIIHSAKGQLKMPRLFIAIDLPEEQKRRIDSISYGLPETRWIVAEQIHLTLRFIGEVNGTSYERISDALSEVQSDPFELRVKGIGHFPPRRTPRVLWLGLDKSEPLLQLQRRVEAKLQQSGLAPEGRKFSPHITIARFKNPPLDKVVAFMAAHSLFELPPFRPKDFHLYSSFLTSGGAVHTLEASYPLRAK